MPKTKECPVEDCFSEEYDKKLLEAMKRIFGNEHGGVLQHISLEAQYEESETIYSVKFYIKHHNDDGHDLKRKT